MAHEHVASRRERRHRHRQSLLVPPAAGMSPACDSSSDHTAAPPPPASTRRAGRGPPCSRCPLDHEPHAQAGAMDTHSMRLTLLRFRLGWAAQPISPPMGRLLRVVMLHMAVGRCHVSRVGAGDGKCIRTAGGLLTCGSADEEQREDARTQSPSVSSPGVWQAVTFSDSHYVAATAQLCVLVTSPRMQVRCVAMAFRHRHAKCDRVTLSTSASISKGLTLEMR